jgi:hypothetical protein
LRKVRINLAGIDRNTLYPALLDLRHGHRGRSHWTAIEPISQIMPRRNTVVTTSKADTLNLMQACGLGRNPRLRTLLCTFTLGVAMAAFAPHAAAQQETTGGHPSNAQLADPKIEARAESLLRQMTIEEKLGQLVQYNDTGDSPDAQTADQKPADNAGVIVAINPVAANHVDSRQLAATGRMGSMLNTIGAARTDMYQHLAVDQSRLHIPLLFGADVIHGYRTIYPIPLGLGASWDPQLLTALCHMSAEEASTAGVRWFYSPMVDISRDARPRAQAKMPTWAQPWRRPISAATKAMTWQSRVMWRLQ